MSVLMDDESDHFNWYWSNKYTFLGITITISGPSKLEIFFTWGLDHILI